MIHPSEAALVQRVVAETFGEPVGIAKPDDLRRALARPFAVSNGIPEYPTFFNKLSVLLYGLLDAKPFAGANRRTAVTILALLLDEKGYRLTASAEETRPLLQGVEIGFMSWHRVSGWIKGHTVRRRPGK